MSEQLLHYTSEPLREVRPAPQEADLNPYGKPNGLWLSVDEAWPEWCRDEDYGNPGDQLCYEVVVDESEILYLATENDVRQFTVQYGGDAGSSFLERFGIGWGQVAADFGGIIIAPYQWGCRFDPQTNWYYGWDCASGCVWTPDAVTSIVEVSSAPAG